MDKADFVESSTSFLHPYLELVKEDEDLTPYFDLPSVLVPPEVIELENLADGAVDNAPVQKNEEWPEYRVKIFDNDVGDLLCPALPSTLKILLLDYSKPDNCAWLCCVDFAVRCY